MYLPFDQAATRIGRLTNNPDYSFRELIYLAEVERLSIYFKYKGDIDATCETAPDGSCKAVGAIRFNGIVKLLQGPTTEDSISEFGIAVSLVECYTLAYKSGNKYHPPVQGEFGGEIAEGYTVGGLIAEADIPRSQWMVSKSDIDRIIETINISDGASFHQVNDPDTASEPAQATEQAPNAPADTTAPAPPGTTTVSDPVTGAASRDDTLVIDGEARKPLSWRLIKCPHDLPGYRWPLYQFLTHEHAAGTPNPTAVQALATWKTTPPAGLNVVTVGREDLLEFTLFDGNKKTANRKAIQASIEGLIVRIAAE